MILDFKPKKYLRKKENNKDENVRKFALSAIRGKRERKYIENREERDRERKKRKRD